MKLVIGIEKSNGPSMFTFFDKATFFLLEELQVMMGDIR